MAGAIREYTPNYRFGLINFDAPNWASVEYTNWRLADALLATLGIGPIRGAWDNAVDYEIGDRVVDITDGTIYVCAVEHTSADAPTTFSADRVAHPTYWTAFASFVPPGGGGITQQYQTKLQKYLDSSDYTDPTTVVDKAFAVGAAFHVRRGITSKMACNPSTQDFQDRARWFAAGHMIEENANAYLEIADGLHSVNTYLDITGNRFLDMRATAAPQVLTISAITITPVTGTTYEAAVTVTTPCGSHVQNGFVVGAYLVDGNNGADGINGAGVITAINAGRDQITFRFRSEGAAAPTTPGVITSGSLIIPRFTIQASSAGWDGSAREGFINGLDGGRIHMYYCGLSYNGAADAHDLIGLRDGRLRLMDYNVLSGAGAWVIRGDESKLYSSRSCIGPGIIGSGAISMQNTGNIRADLTMLGGGTADTLALIDGASGSFGRSRFVGGNRGTRITDHTSRLYLAQCAYRYCNVGLSADAGEHTIDSSVTTSIERCISPMTITQGKVFGPISTAGNTNAMLASDTWLNGGYWQLTNVAPTDTRMRKIARGASAYNFASIAAGAYEDSTDIAMSGAAFGDHVEVTPNAAYPASGIVWIAYVSSAGNIKIRCINHTTGAIDPANTTFVYTVWRSA